ncbi:MAG: hypothetical protein EDM05_67820 [Leptolyngbya sp. IPPAS B-1204]|uniref:Uncharacterized protein n=1 Tax=Leptolyngbya sp. NK1-12 TaxID=2547451 RepID=A0AA97AFX8_9CYAN|nr:hypothetical protein [Leptolyngbya sp. NK1-12]MBF2048935.1 hypothetical protein [Elainella sp. C42_A2020_010]RNJ66349.1 MAG: hypothetical protein EDM05_26475 [Leptolyngbya sp. IPPAS B-1204]WNZ23670.1 hypothetical protein HJG54_12940 [Leptolyngbya sp. NK1-12]
MRPTRTKLCAHCQVAAAQLFRARVDASNQWIFLCSACLPVLKENNPHYVYGGTWKAAKKR